MPLVRWKGKCAEMFTACRVFNLNRTTGSDATVEVLHNQDTSVSASTFQFTPCSEGLPRGLPCTEMQNLASLLPTLRVVDHR